MRKPTNTSIRTGSELLGLLCANRGLDPSWVALVAQHMVTSGGIDTSDLTEEMVMSGLNRLPQAPWMTLYSSLSEMLFFYATLEGFNIDTLDGLAAVGTVAIVSAGIPTGYGTGYELSNICRVLSSLEQFLYEDIDDVFCFVASQLAHPEPLQWDAFEGRGRRL